MKMNLLSNALRYKQIGVPFVGSNVVLQTRGALGDLGNLEGLGQVLGFRIRVCECKGGQYRPPHVSMTVTVRYP